MFMVVLMSALTAETREKVLEELKSALEDTRDELKEVKDPITHLSMSAELLILEKAYTGAFQACVEYADLSK